MATKPMHLDGVSIAKAIDDAAGDIEAATVAAASDTGVVHPANVAYTAADQTALAAAVQDLTTKFNALLTSLKAAGVVASS